MEKKENTECKKDQNYNFTFIDLFAGIGGFRIALEELGGRCVYSSEIDPHACKMYEANFGENPYSDITKVDAAAIPDFDVLCASFPCQSFSKAGKQEGFQDKERGLLFFEIERILASKKPKAFFLENVKNLIYHDKGNTLGVILETLSRLGYTVSWQVLNSRDFNLPQNRERVFIVGSLNGYKLDFGLLKKDICFTMEPYLDKQNNDFSYLNPSEYTILNPEYIRTNKKSGLRFVGYINKEFRKNGVNPDTKYYSRNHRQPNRIYSVKGTHPTISSGETTGRYWIYDRDRVRKLTLDEIFRFFGFPDTFIKTGSKTQLYKRIGNSVCIPVVKAVMQQMLDQFDFK